MSGKTNIKFERYFTKNIDKGIYDQFDFEKTDIQITDDMGKPIFIQKNVEFPSHWSPLARKIVSSKYFYGELGSDKRENSVKSLVERVSETFADWSIKKSS